MGYLRQSPPGAFRRGRCVLRSVPGTLILVVLAVSCTGNAAGDGAGNDPESILLGGHKCMEATDCPSRLCSVGLCLGYLAASTEEARETVAPALRAVAASAQPGAVEALLDAVLADRSSDSFVRGRAADAFRHLPADAAVRVLPPFLADVDEPVRFFAARALAAAGDPRGREALAAWRDHPAEAVRILAARALGDAASGDQGVNRK